MFQKRHYEWLARWARQDLPIAERICLRNALASEARQSGVNFNPGRFDKATGADEYLAGRAALVWSAQS